MANDSSVQFNMDNLTDLIQNLKEEAVLRVGILGDKATNAHDSGSGLTNAEIGTFHEFGGKNLPRRSFLEDSLKLKLKFNSSQFTQMRKQIFKQMFIKHSTKTFLQDLGVKCLEIIEDGFASNGFGLWKPLSAKTMAAFENKKGITGWRNAKSIATYRKGLRISGGRNILTDTGKLRHSISFKVITKK